MKHSLTYYITLLVIKLKGLKNDFSKDPINYKKIRREDVHTPKGKFFTRGLVRNFRISNSTITEIGQEKTTDRLLIFVHGGAFISGPAQYHWDSIRTISERSNCVIWMCDYPKAPENKIDKISDNMDAIYESALERYASKNITLLGDSVGATLIASLIQRIYERQVKMPDKIILVSPVMDASMTNPDIDKIDQLDPMLSKNGVLSAKKMCAINGNVVDKAISPINGNFDGFPDTILFLAEHDITYPDQLRTVQKMKNSNVNVEVITGEGMPHIWPFLPIMKEAKVALLQIISMLR